jgi:glutamate-5-semialdehyde dehydrogenase
LVPESKLKLIRAAARALRLSDVKIRNKVLLFAAQQLLANEKKILLANQKDLHALNADTTPAFRDRLILTAERLQHMATSLKQVAALKDPLAIKGEKKVLKNKLILKKVRSPLGVVFMIFESRPNVAVEAFSMGFKSGNAMILRGGKESRFTTAALYDVLKIAIKKFKLPADVLWGITDPSRDIVNHLLTQKNYIDVVVPRGGDGLIDYVVKKSHIAIIKNDRGMCHVYVHSDADLNMAVKILVNAKTQRPGVCNSMETMLIHKSVAAKLLPLVSAAMKKNNVKWYGDLSTVKILGAEQVQDAKPINWNTEYLDQIVNCRVVSGIDQAIAHIEEHGSRHSEAIITKSKSLAQKFQNEIDAAVVYWNASTRFTDGFEFGLGGELGISTQKLHVRGPVGLSALTNERWIVDGTGQTR